VWSYDVKVGTDLVLDVDAKIAGDPKQELRIDDDMKPFVDGSTHGTAVRYRVRLAEAARRLNDVDTAYESGGAVFAPPSSWLLRPTNVPSSGRFRVHVATAEGVDFATGLHGAGKDTWEADVDALEESGFAAFGALRRGRVAGHPVDLVVARDVKLSDAVVTRWLTTEVGALEGWSLRPWPSTLFVAPGEQDVMRGKTLGDGGATVLFRVGKAVTAANIMEDWVAAHELVHVSFPALDPDHAWFAEGMATYVEPLARVRAGLLSSEKMWNDLVEGLPRGVSPPDAGGLVGTHDVDRVYWGGALYFLLADLRIRQRTNGQHSLEDAMAAASHEANVTTHWPIDRVLSAGDHATGTNVLAELYGEMAKKAFAFDLAALWARLGIKKGGASVTFDDHAPDAALRQAVTRNVARRSVGL